MRNTPAAHGIHSQTPAAPAVPNRLGSRKKMAVVMLTIENAMANEPYGPSVRRSDWAYPNWPRSAESSGSGGLASMVLKVLTSLLGSRRGDDGVAEHLRYLFSMAARTR